MLTKPLTSQFSMASHLELYLQGFKRIFSSFKSKTGNKDSFRGIKGMIFRRFVYRKTGENVFFICRVDL